MVKGWVILGLAFGVALLMLNANGPSRGTAELSQTGGARSLAVQRAAAQRLLHKQLLWAYTQALARAPLSEESAYVAPSELRQVADPDDKIKVDDPNADSKDQTDIARIFGLGPFGVDGQGLASMPLSDRNKLHIALKNHLLPIAAR